MTRSLLLVLVLALPLSAAPAPFPGNQKPRPIRRASLIGTWQALWNGAPCEFTFAADGTYTYRPGGLRGQVWVGTWSFHGRTLRVCEQYGLGKSCAPPPSGSCWEVDLDSRMDGTTREKWSGSRLQLLHGKAR
jgi:hypothetical protein